MRAQIARSEPPQLPLVIPACPCSTGGLAEPPHGRNFSSCHSAEGSLQSQPGLQPACWCSWVPLGFAAFLFNSFRHLIFVSEEMEVIKGSVDCPVTGFRQA